MRRRYQRGSLQAVKHGRHRVWAVWYYDQDRVRRSKVLGRCSQLTQGDAERLVADFLRPINSGAVPGATLAYTFEQFVRQVYLPFCRSHWKASTAATSEQIIETHLIPEFGKVLLCAIRREQMQAFLDRLAKEFSASVVAHARWFLNAIFKLALSDGIVQGNPAAELRIPKKCQPGRAIHPLTEKEVHTYLEAMPLREKLIARLAIFEGMRAGEILALRWEAITDDSIYVKERVYKRLFDTPKNGKHREGALSDGTLSLVKEWAELAEDPTPRGFVFPSERLTTPLSLDNLWRRNMVPKLRTVGLEWASFQVLRKTNATLSKKAGVDPKVSSDQRGHGIGVSLEVYTSSDLAQKKEAVRRLEAAVLRNQQPANTGAGPNPA